MPKNRQQPPSRALVIALILSLLLGFWLLRQFITLIIAAIVVAYLFTPVYKYLLKRTKNSGTAAGLTLGSALVSIVIPLALIIYITVRQAGTMLNDLTTFLTNNSFGSSPQAILDWFNRVASDLIGREVLVTLDQVWDQIAKVASTVASFVVDIVQSWAGSIGGVVTGAILFMYIFTAILVHQEKLLHMIRKLNPLGEEVTGLYLTRAGAVTKGMVKGQFVIAILQGVISAVVLYVTGVPYFAFFVLLLSFLSLIPLGAGIITIPLGIIRILLGDYWQGIVILLNHFIIVTNIDNVLKPKLVPKSARLHPALTLLSVFAGIGIFGFLGIIIGPVLMILVVTTIEVYLKAVAPAAEAETTKRAVQKNLSQLL